MNIIFFGSTSDSVIVLEFLFQFSCRNFCLPEGTARFVIASVVTQPPTRIGRKQVMTSTPVQVWAEKHSTPVLSFSPHKDKPWLYDDEQAVANTLSTFKPDLVVSACYGQKIPKDIITQSRFGGLNVHPSLLPRWRGADPVPWTILSGDRQTGVTVVTLSQAFDEGEIVSQKKITVSDIDYTDSLRTKLFTVGAKLLIESLPDYISGKRKKNNRKPEKGTYARRFTRQDGFIPWEHVQSAIEGNDIKKENRIGIPHGIDDHISFVIARMIRALSPWPGVWTIMNLTNPANKQIRQTEKRLKILEAHVKGTKLILDSVQLEGKKPVSWEQFNDSYLVS